MKTGPYNIRLLLKALYARAEGIGERTFTTDRPLSVPDRLNDFVVVSVPSRIRDRLGLGDTTARVSLYVRDRDSGVENVERAGEMQETLYGRFPCSGGLYLFGKPVLIPGGSDRNGFHVYHFQMQVTIL